MNKKLSATIFIVALAVWLFYFVPKVYPDTTYWQVKNKKGIVIDDATIEMRTCHCGQGSKLLASFKTLDTLYTSCVDSNGCLDIQQTGNESIANREVMKATEKCNKEAK